MTKNTTRSSNPGLRWWAFSATVVAITGGVGLLFVLNQLYPTSLIVRLLFMALLFVTVGAAVIPFSIYFNQRFADKKWLKQDPNRLFRHSIEGGLMVVILAYLQLIRALDWTITLVLISVFVLMEIFYLTRT